MHVPTSTASCRDFRRTRYAPALNHPFLTKCVTCNYNQRRSLTHRAPRVVSYGPKRFGGTHTQKIVLTLATLIVLVTTPARSQSPTTSAAPTPVPRAVMQCVSPLGPVRRSNLMRSANDLAVWNRCRGNIDVMACYANASQCWENDVPPRASEELFPASVIDSHGGIRFYACVDGQDPAFGLNGRPTTQAPQRSLASQDR